MAEATEPYGRKTQKEPAVKEVHILWITAGLELRRRLRLRHRRHASPASKTSSWAPFPACPRSICTTACSPMRVGDEFMKYWYAGRTGPARRSLRPRRRGIDPQRGDQERRLLGRDWAPISETGQPITTLRMDRPPGSQGVGRGGGRHLRHLRRHPRHGRQSHRRDGPGRLPRLELAAPRPDSRSSTSPAARFSRTT